MYKQATIGTYTVNVYTKHNFFVLQEIYSKFIKEVSCPSKISFYMRNKNNRDYIIKYYYSDVVEDIDAKFVHRNKVIFITKDGLNKFISKNKKKISANCPGIFDDFDPDDEFDWDLATSVCGPIVEPTFLELETFGNANEGESCAICFNKMNEIYTVQEFQQNYYSYMTEQQQFRDESLKNANCLIKCQSCLQPTCLFCSVKKQAAFIPDLGKCCLCRQPNDIQTNDPTANIQIKIQESRNLRTAMLVIIIVDQKSVLLVQFDGIKGYRLILQNDMFSNLWYYDPDMTEPQRSQYSLYTSNLTSFDDWALLMDLNNKHIHLRSARHNGMIQMLGVNQIRITNYIMVYTYDHENLTKIERYSEWGVMQSQLYIPHPNQFDQLLSTNPQSKIAPKSSPNRYCSIQSYINDSQFASNEAFMVFINEYQCYCGESIPIKAYYIYNKDRKIFKAKDIIYNLKKQGLRIQCNHNFLESIDKLNTNIYTLSFGS